jgi:hypothetical protein
MAPYETDVASQYLRWSVSRNPAFAMVEVLET